MTQRTHPRLPRPHLAVRLERDTLHVGELAITFHRTLRIPDDGSSYPLPPSLGSFPVSRVDDFADRVPDSWLDHGGVFLPMYQREAMWLSFGTATHWRPVALKVAVGMVNAVSGKPWSQAIGPGRQDYLVCPPQPWLDGIKSGDGVIRQFVAMPLGMGYTVEGQVTGEERFGGIQLVAFAAKPGRFSRPPRPYVPRHRAAEFEHGVAEAFASLATATAAGAEMGLGAGGLMEQKLYPDLHGWDTWDNARFGRVYVHIVNSLLYREITGRRPPESPISARTYTEHGYPWFDLYDEHLGDIDPSEILGDVRSVSELDEEKGVWPQQDDETIVVPGEQVVTHPVRKPRPPYVSDGDWPR